MKIKSTISKSVRALVLTVLATAPLGLWALPANQTALNAQVQSTSSGVAVTSTSATRVDVAVTGNDKAIINWVNFGDSGTANAIGAGDTVVFSLPSASSAILNRVVGSTTSTILGTISANGKVYLINTNGIVIGTTASITTNGFAASTAGEPDGYSFLTTGSLSAMDGSYVGASAPVTVNGTPTFATLDGNGNVYLIGNAVTVQGGTVTGNLIIRSNGGAATLSALSSLALNSTLGLGGNLSVYSKGGNIDVANAAGTNIAGNATLDASGGANTGAIVTTTAAGLVSSGSASTASLTSGSSAGVTFKGKFVTETVNSGSDVALTQTSGDLTLGASTINGNLAVTTAGKLLNSGTVALKSGGSTVTLTAGGNVKLVGTGKWTVAAPTTTGGVDLQTNGDLTWTDAGNTYDSINLASSAGKITSTGAAATTVTGTGTYTANAAGNVDLSATTTLTAAKAVSITSTGGTLKTPGTAIAGADAVTISGNGDVTLVAAGSTGNKAVSVTSTTGKITATGLLSSTGGTSATLGLTANTAGGNVSVAALTDTGGLTVNTGGTFTATGTITDSKGVSITSAGTLTTAGYVGSSTITLKSTGGNVVDAVGVISTGDNVSVTSTTGSVTLADADTIATKNLSITAGTNIDLSAATLTTIAAKNVTLTSTGGTIALNTAGTMQAAADGAININATGNISLPGAIGTAAGKYATISVISTGGSVTTGAINATNAAATAGALTVTGFNGVTTGALSANQTLALTNTGDLALSAALTAPTVSVTSTNGSISQAAGANVINSSTKTKLSAGGGIDLTTGASTMTAVELTGAPSGAKLLDTATITLQNSTPTGNLTLTSAGSIVLGASINSSNIGAASKFVTTAGGTTISDTTDGLTFAGSVELNTGGGAVAITHAGHNFGQILGATLGGTFSIVEAGTLNLGKLSLGAGTLTATSTAGDIVNSGAITAANATFTAGPIGGPKNVTINNNSNAFSGTVTVGNANNFTLVDSVSLTNIAASNPILGTSSITLLGSSTLTGTTADFTTLAIAAGGNVTVTDPNGFTLNGVNISGGTANLAATTGKITVTNFGVSGSAIATVTATAGSIDLGSGITTSTTGLVTFKANGTVGNKDGKITQVGGPISIYGPITFDASGADGSDITINTLGNAFGGISLLSTNGNASLTENSYSKLEAVTLGNGNLSMTSSIGGIFQDVGSVISVTKGTSTFNASGATVTLDGATNNFKGTVAITALGDVKLVAGGANDLTLGNISTSGKLTVTAGAAGLNIAQTSGTSLYAYDATAFTVSGAGKITLTNTGSNLGQLTFSAGTGAVAYTESGTINIKNATFGGGAVTLTSTNGSIIQQNAFTTAGDLTAKAAGAVTLTSASNSFAKVTVIAGASSAITSTSALTLGGGAAGTNVTGDYTAKATAGTITDAGFLTVSGKATIDAGANNINLTDSGSTYGSLVFKGAIVNISGNGLAIGAGSSASGAATLTSVGSITTTGAGGAVFSSTITLNATGLIKITNPWSVSTAGLIANSPVGIDLSYLSLSGNLGNTAPVVSGAGSIPPAYLAPSP
jgi:fibronectin-binding autotransporter adhesin